MQKQINKKHSHSFYLLSSYQTPNTQYQMPNTQAHFDFLALEEYSENYFSGQEGPKWTHFILSFVLRQEGFGGPRGPVTLAQF